ncbi:MAG: heme A synthase [Thermoleophilaceae bacterium]|nr:heme A synthase [Thermoleophilaceae bacterium]
MFSRLREKTDGFTVTPEQFTKIAFVGVLMLTLIVATGSAVRLSNSGLGCPDWPRCYGKAYPPADLHSIVEFGNRVLSGLVTLGVFAAAFAAMRRRPYRRDLTLLAWCLPLGALIQAVLGALSVESELQYEWVMAHFTGSMIIAIAGVALIWRSMHEPGSRPRSEDRLAVWSIRGLLVMTAAAWISGMATTAAGPHAGGDPGSVARWEPRGGDSLEWVVHRHGRVADVLGILAVLVWLLLWRRGASRELRLNSTIFVVLLGIQGLIGSIQWNQQLPAELVWLHVVFGTLCWISALWFTCVAGRIEPRPENARATLAPEQA